jgi:hypothetical protein
MLAGIVAMVLTIGPLLTPVVAAEDGQVAEPPRRPNIVVILADDKY